MIKTVATSEHFIVAARKKDGKFVYVAGAGTPKPRTTTNPGEADQYGTDVDKSELALIIDKIKRYAICRTVDLDTLCFMHFETKLSPIDITNPDWASALQRNAVKKLNTMEIKALGLEKYEIDRRMSSSNNSVSTRKK